jgi:hypothetical protein
MSLPASPTPVSDYGLRDATVHTNQILRAILEELKEINGHIKVLSGKKTRVTEE